ncbi:MAG TPA: PIN domain-containing protein [Thermoplasmata archaeon]|nr:PIN domain-containing protein [Thermoplasmata archaeon]
MIFIDTSAWYALLTEKDIHRPEAEEFFAEIGKGHFGAPLTTDYVLDETFTLLRLRGGVTAVRRLADLLRRSPTVRRVRISEAAFEAGLDMIVSHADKKWSFTDCTSFVTMRDAGVSRAFTLDRNFAEAGFEILPQEWAKPLE